MIKFENSLNNIDLSFNKKKELKEISNNDLLKITKAKHLKTKCITYENCLKFAKNITELSKYRYYAILSGNFIFGDLIEAILVENNIKAKSLYISTLSLNDNNIFSLKNLIKGDYIEKINIIISDYFLSHERHDLIKLIYETLENNKITLSATRIHTKICCFETEQGQKVVIHGSANLRTSDNLEQIMIEMDSDLYDFNVRIMDKIIKDYQVTRKVKQSKNLYNLIKEEY